MFKKFFLHILLVVILASVLCFGYIQAMDLPSYAVTEEDWQALSTNSELVESFRSYCKSRDLTIEGSFADDVTNFSSQMFYNITKTLGIDLTQLMAEVQKYTPDGLGTRFYLSSTGIGLFNQIFAQLLYDYDLSVGDQDVDKNVYTGYSLDGYPVWVSTNSSAGHNNEQFYQYVTARGSYYIYDNPTLKSVSSASFPTFNYSVPVNQANGFNASGYTTIKTKYLYTSVRTADAVYYGFDGTFKENYGQSTSYAYGYPIVLYLTQTHKFYLCFYSHRTGYQDRKNISAYGPSYTPDGDPEPSTVDIVSPTIKQPLPDDEPLQILPDGNTTTDSTPDDGSGSGSGGDGGGSGGEGGGSDTDVDITIPNFNFSFPDIDFQLDGLTNKFPFCIPGDMVSLVTLLNADPVAPRIQGSVPLGSWTTWEIDFDFARFDDFAALMRGFELVGFIFFLVGATIRIVKG